MKKRNILAVGLFASVMLMGCGDTNTIATVDGRDITKAEFDAYLKFKRIPEQDQARVDRALEEYLNRAALAVAIEESGAMDADLIQAELEEFRRQMLIGRYFDDHLKNAVDDDAIRNYYSNHADQYESQRMQVAHILFRVNPSMGESERQAKLTSAHEAYSRIKKGEDFAVVAKELSEDTVSAQKGGELGWLAKGAVDPKFSEVLFSLKPEEVSEPVLTPFGFHIIKAIEGPQVVKQPVEAVEGDIRYQLRNEAKVSETERLLKSVKIDRKDNEK